MATNSLFVSESWDKIYKAFETVSFTSYDYDSIKQSLIDTIKFQYPENFNDYIESSTFIALIETFAYVAEQLSYRVDMAAHENFISTAERKQSILKLAKMVSYTSTRNIPLRGLVKITSISCSENLNDGQGNNLTNKEVHWNDTNNVLWKEQFNIVLNKVLINKIGNPSKSFQIDDTLFQRYEINNILEKDARFTSFTNGNIPLKINVDGDDLAFELVASDIDSFGVLEKEPNINENFSILYGNDGFGDSSDTTGFMMLLKQGTLNKISHIFDSQLPNRILDINVSNINDTDVWIQEVDSAGNILHTWEQISTITGTNVHFNVSANRKKYEVSSLEDDKIRIIFGDGDFSEIPTGIFNIWCRSSNSGEKTLPRNKVVNNQLTFGYYSKTGARESCSIKYSLVSSLQNASLSEDIEHIRDTAPTTYYSQNRMVNGQDYNTFMLKDPSILRLKALNRTFAGQSKNIKWNDASGSYQNVKIFGDDAIAYLDNVNIVKSTSISGRTLIDKVLEPLLRSPGIQNLLTYTLYNSIYPYNSVFTRPRKKFIERYDQTINGTAIQEKNEIQGSLDRHWYGQPDSIVMLNSNYEQSTGALKPYALINSDTDKFIYDPTLKLVTKNNAGIFQPVNLTSNNTSGFQDYISRYKKFGIKFNPIRSASSFLEITDEIAYDVNTMIITQSIAIEENLTIEITDEITGTFSVYGSKTGIRLNGTVGTTYDDGLYKFLILSNYSTPLVLGDSFFITITYNGTSFIASSFLKQNLLGRFEIIPESLINSTTLIQNYDQNHQSNSWIFLIERVDNLDGNFLYWNIHTRDLKIIIESKTTKFFVDELSQLVDSETKRPVKDIVKILKSNLNAAGTRAIGKDDKYDVVADVKYDNGELNVNALSVTATDNLIDEVSGDGFADNPYQFFRFINPTDYVYFEKNTATGKLIPVETTYYISNLVYTNGVSGKYVRKNGRSNLDFLWQHFTSYDRLIDPSPSNINDIYVITNGYYSRVLDYLRGIESEEPKPPTSLELRNSYRDLLSVKMISDTIVMHSGKIKILFGSEAIPELRGVFRVISNPNGKLTDDQIKIKIVDIINEYFKIENWDFGQPLHLTELIAVIHKQLPLDILSVVMVPKYSSNYFGDLFVINAEPNEILHSSAKVSDIEIVLGYDKVLLKQF